jgi:hypothetical protein
MRQRTDDHRTGRAGGGLKCRNLRIAWSVGCGIVCLLLATLWVRSYYRTDLLVGPWYWGGSFNFASMQGQVGLAVMPAATLSFGVVRDPSDRLFVNPEYGSRLGFRYSKNAVRHKVVIPYWFLVCATLPLTFVPWIRTRFSLRTILIGLTLVAVALGMVVLAAK